MKIIADILARIAELEQRVATMIQHGAVHEVDAANQKVRIRLGGDDSAPYLSPWMPYSQMAGAFKGHVPVTEGQNMTVLAPGGVPEQAFAAPMTFNTANPSPSQKGDENVWTYGQAKIELRDKEAVVTLGDTQVKIDASGLTIKGQKYAATFDQYEHN